MALKKLDITGKILVATQFKQFPRDLYFVDRKGRFCQQNNPLGYELGSQNRPFSYKFIICN